MLCRFVMRACKMYFAAQIILVKERKLTVTLVILGWKGECSIFTGKRLCRILDGMRK